MNATADHLSAQKMNLRGSGFSRVVPKPITA